jgi:hypothetical protein
MCTYDCFTIFITSRLRSLFLYGGVVLGDCGLANLGSCIWEKLFDFIAGLLSAPLQPLLDWIKGLMVANVNTQTFAYLWAVIMYVLSLFLI